MAQMYINYGSFEDWAGKISAKNDKLKDNLNEIKNLINSLAGEWESDSAAKIREKITGMQPKFDQYYDVVNNYAVFLKNTATQWKNTEIANTNNASEFI